MSEAPFRTLTLGPIDALGEEPFVALGEGVDFMELGKGREGTHLVAPGERGVPLVRTTARYARPPSRFSPAHRAVAAAIEEATGAPGFNNALIEVYDRGYTKMGYHSDLALDLEAGSFIALYSCYARPADRSGLRTLEVKEKASGARTGITLEHGSVVMFSLEANAAHTHRIVLGQQAQREPENRWLGLTLRRSGTWVRHEDGHVLFADGTPLTLAEGEDAKAFYRLRGRENRDQEFAWPRVDVTLSEADLMGS